VSDQTVGNILCRCRPALKSRTIGPKAILWHLTGQPILCVAELPTVVTDALSFSQLKF